MVLTPPLPRGADAWPLADAVFVDTGDPETARREMSRILAPHAMQPPPGTGEFRAIHRHGRLGNLSINVIYFAPGAHVRSGPTQSFYLMHLVLSGRCVILEPDRRVALDAGDIGIINPFAPLGLDISGDCAQIVIKIDRRSIESLIPDHVRARSPLPLTFDPVCPRGSAAVASLRDMIDLVCRECERAVAGHGSPATEDAIAALFATALLERCPNNVQRLMPQRARTVAPWYVKRVEEFIELQAASPIRIADMAAVAGVSERALYKGFRAWRETTPMGALKAVRLDRARTALLGDAAPPLSVADIARACGFTHLGNFARDYRLRFGERPSDTRRYRLDAPPRRKNDAE